jgi:hypothetical protein
LLNLATTLPLVGLIWLVQVVAYPLFAKVGPSEFGAYHEAHSRLITFVVGPLMVGELVASLALWADATVPRWLAGAAGALAVSTWLFTMFVSVPKHTLLATGFEECCSSAGWARRLAAEVRARGGVFKPTRSEKRCFATSRGALRLSVRRLA